MASDNNENPIDIRKCATRAFYASTWTQLTYIHCNILLIVWSSYCCIIIIFTKLSYLMYPLIKAPWIFGIYLFVGSRTYIDKIVCLKLLNLVSHNQRDMYGIQEPFSSECNSFLCEKKEIQYKLGRKMFNTISMPLEYYPHVLCLKSIFFCIPLRSTRTRQCVDE